MDRTTLVGSRVGGFAVEAVVGHGSCATVYLARSLRLDRLVALKVLDPTLARKPDLARRFETEGRIAAQLDHPNIVPVFEAGDDDGIVYLAMRLVKGPTLSPESIRQGAPKTTWVDSLIRPLADALDHAHGRGVIHRDVKPANVMIEDGQVWLGDFGIAATTRAAAGYTKGVIGTAAYMAPEQARQAPVDGRADLYSLGCMAYELHTGSPPFGDDDFVRLLYAHAHEEIPKTGDAEMDGFFEVALAKDPERRWATGAAFVAALGSALELDTPDKTQVGTAPRAAPGTPRRPDVPATERAPHGRRWRVPVVVALLLAVLTTVVVVVATRPGTRAPVVLTSPTTRPSRATTSLSPQTTTFVSAAPDKTIIGVVTGPAVVHAPERVRYALGDEWSASRVEKASGAVDTTISISGVPVGDLNYAPSNAITTGHALTAAELQAQDKAGCPTVPDDLQLGGLPAVKCVVPEPTGSPSTEDDKYYVSRNGDGFYVLLSFRMSAADRDRFVSGLQFLP